MGYFPQAQHTRVAQFVSLEVTDSTYGLGVWYNLSSQALSITTRSRIVRHYCAALSVDFLVCVAEWYLILRICGYMAHEVRPCGRKDPLPFLYSLSSANFAVLNRKKDDSQEGGNLGSLLLVPLPGRQDSACFVSNKSPFQQKLSY